MTLNPKAPEGPVADAVKGNWVDQFAPAVSRPYLRLSRADRPVGTWLLFLPCIWGILLAALSDGQFHGWDIWLIASCGGGAWLMRGAGCTWNDITDRKFDAQVERTKSRPIPSGQVSVMQALIWMAVQALLAFAILLTYGMPTILIGIASLGFVAIYPFAKRFTWWPQAFLGLAFNWGALLGWVAHTGNLAWPPVFLYLAGIAWTLFYDTIYAHQDTEDDALIGVKSTARLFGEDSPTWLKRFLFCAVALMILAIVTAIPTLTIPLFIAIIATFAFGGHMFWQISHLKLNRPDVMLRIFRSNRDAGLIPVLFFALALML
ncbi:MAG: 4-hydroxybenzoate octaprenyltransferase [Planktomarina sp.]